MENLIFGDDFYAQLFPEGREYLSSLFGLVVLCVIVTTFSVGSIHRVCGTVG